MANEANRSVINAARQIEALCHQLNERIIQAAEDGHALHEDFFATTMQEIDDSADVEAGSKLHLFLVIRSLLVSALARIDEKYPVRT